MVLVCVSLLFLRFPLHPSIHPPPPIPPLVYSVVRYTLDQALAHPWVQGTAASDTPIEQSVVRSMFNFTAKNKFKKEALKLIARYALGMCPRGMRVWHGVERGV
jgi:hypothetical protein